MTPQPHILGVILAGGSARRMGGGDKGLTDVGGQPMLAHVIGRFRPQVGALILNANGDPARFRQFTLPVVPDLDQRALGPLSGILAAMNWAEISNSGLTHIVTVTTDTPFLPMDLVARLSAASQAGPGLGAPGFGGPGFGGSAIAVSAGRRHPAIGLWPLALKSEVEAALARQELSVNAFAARHAAIEVVFPFSETGGEHIDPFFNANTPDDVEAARRLIAL